MNPTVQPPGPTKAPRVSPWLWASIAAGSAVLTTIVGLGTVALALMIVHVGADRKMQPAQYGAKPSDPKSERTNSPLAAVADKTKTSPSNDFGVANVARRQLADEIDVLSKRARVSVYYRMNYASSGPRVVELAVDVKEKSTVDGVRTIELAPNVGLPLRRIEDGELKSGSWHVEAPPAPSRMLVQAETDTSHYRLQVMKPFGTPPERSMSRRLVRNNDHKIQTLGRYDHKHLWSPEGRYLYVVIGGGYDTVRNMGINRLLQINTSTWEIERQVHPRWDIWDITWSSEGLVAMGKFDSYPGRRDAKGKRWRRLATSTREDRRKKAPRRLDPNLLVLDPNTLAIRRMWRSVGGYEAAGSHGDPLVYLRQGMFGVNVINVKTGEFLSKFALAAPAAERKRINLPPGRTGRYHHFMHPVLSPDGKWLFTNEFNTKRFERNGVYLRWQETRPNEGSTVETQSVTLSGGFLSVPRGDGYDITAIDDLSKSVGRISTLPGAGVALDPTTKTVYVCAADWKEKKLLVRMIRGASRTDVVLAKEIRPHSTTNSIHRDDLSDRIRREKMTRWPYAMSVDPLGRGVIVFTEPAAYWVEPKRLTGDRWAFLTEEIKPPDKLAQLPPSRSTDPPVVESAGAHVAGVVPSRAESTKTSPPKLLTKTIQVREADGEAGRVMELEDTMTAYDFDPSSGDLAALTRRGELYIFQSAFFDGDASAVTGPLVVGPIGPEHSVAFCFKKLHQQTLLLVARQGLVWAFDAKTLQKADSAQLASNPLDLKLGTANISRLASSQNPSDVNLFLTAYLRSDGSEVAHCRAIDLETGGVRYVGVGVDCQVSSSGRLVYTQDQTSIDIRLAFPTGSPIEATSPRSPFLSLRNIHNDGGAMAIDPLEQIVVDPQAVSHADEQVKITGKRTSLRVLMKQPWIIAQDAGALAWLGRDDGKEGARLSLPGPLLAQESNPAGVMFVADDSRRDRLIVAGNRGLWVLPASAVSLPNRPFAAARLWLPATLAPGESFSAPIFAPQGVSVSLFEGPPSAKLHGQRFLWTPRREEIGPQTIVLKVDSGAKIKRQHYTCVVTDPAVDLPFEPQRVVMSNDGRHALVWNHPNPNDPPMSKAPQLGVVEVNEHKLIVHRTLERPISLAAMNRDHVALIDATGHTLDLLRLNDLSTKKTVRLRRPIVNIQAMSRSLLLLRSRPSVLSALQLPELNETPLTQAISDQWNIGVTRDYTLDGWMVGPVFFDKSMESLWFLHNFKWAGIATANESQSYRGGPHLQTPEHARRRWAGEIPESESLLTGGAPNMSLWAVEASRFGSAQRKSVRLELLLPRLAKHLAPSATSSMRGYRGMMGGGVGGGGGGGSTFIPPGGIPLAWLPNRIKSEHRLWASGEGVAVLADGKLFTTNSTSLRETKPEEGRRPLAPQRDRGPLILRPAASFRPGQCVISPTMKTRLRFTASGGQPPYQIKCKFSKGYEPRKKPDGTEEPQIIEPTRESGVFLIDGPGMLYGAMFRRLGSFRNPSVSDLAKSRGTPQKIVELYLQNANARLQPLLKRRLKGYPVSVPIEVSVTDADSQTVRLTIPLLIETPMETWVRRLERERKYTKPSTSLLSLLGGLERASPELVSVGSGDHSYRHFAHDPPCRAAG